MGGVGPFAVPLAMNNVTVHANDLNPASYKYLVGNCRGNRCEKYLTCYNMDGR
jgi:tRNA (guanine37-N1)-methyltransferase